jgi:hypothetical protein
MTTGLQPDLSVRQAHAGKVTPTPNGWRLSIPGGQKGGYRLAQLDDYGALPRRKFCWHPPLTFSLRARVSAANLPGTWGFGLWNDPFGLSLGFGGTPGRLPALPQAAWFFHASSENYLALRNDLPARGFFAGTFHSPRPPSILLAPGLLALPGLALRPASRLLRRLASGFVQQDGAAVQIEVTGWHTYRLHWQKAQVDFQVDDRPILQTRLSPPSPLGLVIWIDNQYAAWGPDGQLGYGSLENPEAFLEIEAMKLSAG